jgi:ribonuclease P protein component
MLPRSHRLGTIDIKPVLKGKMLHSEHFSLRYIPNKNTSGPRFALSVSKNSYKTAVLRNRIRRKVAHTLLSLPIRTYTIDVLVVVRKGVETLSNKQFVDELQTLCGLLQGRVEIGGRKA